MSFRDYTKKDFNELYSRMSSMCKASFPDWSDFEQSSFGNMLIALNAYLGDMIFFYMDNQAEEARLITAKERKNVKAIAKMFGYSMRGVEPAKSVITLDLSIKGENLDLQNPLSSWSLTIPKNSIVNSGSGNRVEFRIIGPEGHGTYDEPEDIKIEKGQLIKTEDGYKVSIKVAAVNSLERTKMIYSSSYDGSPIKLEYSPVIEGSVRVKTESGSEEYAAVDSLSDYGPSDKVFMCSQGEDGECVLSFPSGSDYSTISENISISFQHGGGKLGNILAGALTEPAFAARDANGSIWEVKSSNAGQASGGYDGDTIAFVKELVPKLVRTSNRCITKEDFENVAELVPGVAKALLVTRQEVDWADVNTGYLFIKPEDGMSFSPNLKSSVEEKLSEYPSPVTFSLRIDPAIELPVNISSRIVLESGASSDSVIARINSALKGYFSPKNEDGTTSETVGFGNSMGNELSWSGIYELIASVEGVEKVLQSDDGLRLNGLPFDISYDTVEYPVLANVEIKIEGES